MASELCDACRVGFQAPFERFRQEVAPLTQAQARSKCSRCGAKAAKIMVLSPV